MPMQSLGVSNKEHYGMLRYFLEWSIQSITHGPRKSVRIDQVSHGVTGHLSQLLTINFSLLLTGLYM